MSVFKVSVLQPSYVITQLNNIKKKNHNASQIIHVITMYLLLFQD